MPKQNVTEEIGLAIARGLLLLVSDIVLTCLPHEKEVVQKTQQRLLEQPQAKTKTKTSPKKQKTKTIDTKAKVINVED